MSHTVKLFERIINHMLRTIVELGNIHFVFRRGRSTVDPVVDRPPKYEMDVTQLYNSS